MAAVNPLIILPLYTILAHGEKLSLILMVGVNCHAQEFRPVAIPDIAAVVNSAG